jgi:hypothetical protein
MTRENLALLLLVPEAGVVLSNNKSCTWREVLRFATNKTFEAIAFTVKAYRSTCIVFNSRIVLGSKTHAWKWQFNKDMSNVWMQRQI